jgi:hypothetical protein
MTNDDFKSFEDVLHVGIGNSMEDPSTSVVTPSENMTSGD